MKGYSTPKFNERARKTAFFVDDLGNNRIDFQFNPPELDFTEENNYVDRVLTGNTDNDTLWVSSKPQSFTLEMFIDRTVESSGSGVYKEEFHPPLTIPPLPGSAGVRSLLIEGNTLVTGLRTAYNRITGSTPPDPQFPESTYKLGHDTLSEGRGYYEENGVYPDLNKLLYFKNPELFTGAKARITNSGFLDITIGKQRKFYTPPTIIFIYGSLWREGRVQSLTYKLSVPNTNLIPQRLEATIGITITGGGNLASIGSLGRPEVVKHVRFL